MNPTMKKLVDKVMATPELKFQNNSSRGYVLAVYYEQRKCDVVYYAPDGAQKIKKRIDMPKDGDGVFTESLKTGDIVELSFQGKTQNNMFISGVQKEAKSKNDFNILKGQELPISTTLF